MIGRLLRNLLGARPSAPAVAREDGVVFLSNIGRSMRVESGTPLDSPSASSRLRVVPAIRALGARHRVWVVSPEDLIADPGLGGFCRPRAIMVTKFATGDLLQHRDRARQLLDAVSTWQGRVPLLADLSDDYAAAGAAAGDDFLARYQSELLDLCAVTVPCEALRAALAPAARHGIRVIEDPWERSQAAPVRVAPGTPLRLAWFGVLNDEALAVLEPACEAVLRRCAGAAVALEIVAAPAAATAVGGLGARLAGACPGLVVKHLDWSREAAWSAIERADCVLLPQADSDWGRVKSHNRLVETIRCGRLALCSPIPSYAELKDFAWVGADLGEGLEWMRANAGAAAARVVAGQAAIEARFSPAVIGAKWLEALGG